MKQALSEVKPSMPVWGVDFAEAGKGRQLTHNAPGAWEGPRRWLAESCLQLENQETWSLVPILLKFTWINSWASLSVCVKWGKPQWPYSSQNLVQTHGQNSWILEAKRRNWIQTGAELWGLFLHPIVEMDKRHKAILSCTTTARPHGAEWLESPSAWNYTFQLLFPWVLFLLPMWVQVFIGRFFWF